MAISLAFVHSFDSGTFIGWPAFYNLCLIPFQIVAVVIWAGANPSFVARLVQPVKGIAMLIVTAIAAAVMSFVVLYMVGEGISPPGPIPVQFAVIAVPTTFFLAIIWGGWPFTNIFRNPIVAGLALLIGSYVITYIIWNVFFDWRYLQGAPVYLAS